VPAGTLLRAAVANNAAWCDAVCRSHGHPGEFTARTWLSPGHDLPFYPNAITLSPAAAAADTQAARDPDRAYGVKDSFARLDLAPAGLAPLFDADWIAWDPAPDKRPSAEGLRWQAVSDAAELARWEAAWAGDGDVAGLFRPALLADPGSAFLGCYRDGALAGGAIAYTAAGVTGISNIFATRLPGEVLRPGTLSPGTLRPGTLSPGNLWPGALWRSAVLAAAALRPGLPVVGYEHGEDLAAAREAGGQVLGPLRVWTRGLAVP
jgi:hypothetical protein